MTLDYVAVVKSLNLNFDWLIKYPWEYRWKEKTTEFSRDHQLIPGFYYEML